MRALFAFTATLAVAMGLGCACPRLERAAPEVTPDPTPSSEDASCGPRSFAWESGGVTISLQRDSLKTLRIEGADGVALTRPDEEHVDRCELVELDGAPPMELWIATSAGAHGNRGDAFYAWNGGSPREMLAIATDEGELALEDLDGDGRPEIVGDVTRWFDGDAWDFWRPLVLRAERGVWIDDTRRFPDRIRAMRASHEVVEPFTCTASNAIEVLGLSMLLDEEESGAAWVEALCAGGADWMHANRARLRAHVAESVLTTPS